MRKTYTVIYKCNGCGKIEKVSMRMPSPESIAHNCGKGRLWRVK